MTPRRMLVPAALAALAVGGPLLVPAAPPTDTLPGRDLAYPGSRFAVLGGLEVHHQVRGDADAPAVLLSHHFYGSATTWRHVLDGLGQDHLVAAFDRPGFGLTERPLRSVFDGDNPYTRAHAARIGWELLDHLDARDAVLVGSSAGGTNVLEMYGQQPERVRALVLLSPAITGDVGPPRVVRPVLRSPQGRRLGPRIARRAAGRVTAERISRSWHDPSRATDADAEPYRRMLQVEGWDRGFWEVMNAEPPPDLRSLVRSIEVPTLVVAGASDPVIPPRLNRRTAAAIPGARLELLPDCGHTPQEECPDALLVAVRAFLDDLDR